MKRTSHNPDQYIFSFRQIASNGKKKIGILLGAGAPVSINISKDETWKSLIPNLAGLTKIVKEKLSADDLSAYNSLESSISEPNLEKVLSKIRTISEVIGENKINNYNSTDYQNLSENICNAIRDEVDQVLPVGQNPYTELVSWINGISRKYGVEIFTTNYDLLLEQALERAKTPYFDEFSGSDSAFFDPSTISRNDLPPRWVRLWKLHGSIGWEKNNKNEVTRIPRSKTANMVYPSHIKYDQTQAAPFSSLFERLKNFILEPDTLLLSTGFSFADAHISSKLLESLLANPSSALFAFQYGNLESEIYIKDLAIKCPGISAYCRDGAVINGTEARWKIGSLPARNWKNFRDEYYKDEQFLLGDFSMLSRFLAAAGAEYTLETISVTEEEPENAPDE
ncbi:MAG: SIR2 family protein [Pseudomonas sp.]|uniref:SIR2 family protein n=1 Tax=Pseudomonas sp. TaxID=306 RepID=UPI000CAAF8D3|nr:SIR2 family protein [Pseudomonas sp.]PJI47607.1 MAG: SIR2 family protein [Pseudomonas sp.]